MLVATQTQFDHRNPRYYTCGCCHVRSSVIAISIIVIVHEAMVTITAFTSVPDDTYFCPTMINDFVKWALLVHVIIMVVCTVLAILGVRDNKPAFLIPHIVMQNFKSNADTLSCDISPPSRENINTVIALVIFMVPLLYAMIAGIKRGQSVIIIISTVVFGLVFPFAVWFLVVFVRGYKYLKDRQQFFLVSNETRSVAGSVPITGYNQTVYGVVQQAPSQPNHAQFGYASLPPPYQNA